MLDSRFLRSRELSTLGRERPDAIAQFAVVDLAVAGLDIIGRAIAHRIHRIHRNRRNRRTHRTVEGE